MPVHRRAGAVRTCAGLLVCAATPLAAQDDRSPGQVVRAPDREAGISLGDGGLVLRSADSNYVLTLRFRMQNLVTASSEPGDERLREVDWTVRRARIWLGGHVADPRLTVLFQLGLSRRDQDAETWGYPVLVRDAFATWRWTSHLRTGLGVAKLPGNRNRVLSSADMIFPERGIVNGAFNLDRDIGLQAFWFDTLGHVPVHVSTALTSGRGRAASPARSAALTTRLEVLPLGGFLRGNDYVEGAVQREPHPRVAVGVSTQWAWNTNRTGVTIGPLLGTTTDVTTVYADAVVKWDRFTAYTEYAHRSAPRVVTAAADGAPRFVLTGDGAMAQLSYLIAPRLDLAARASWLWPSGALRDLPGAGTQRQYSLALNRYLRGHRVKVQGEVTRLLVGASGGAPGADTWFTRLNLEVGL